MNGPATAEQQQTAATEGRQNRHSTAESKAHGRQVTRTMIKSVCRLKVLTPLPVHRCALYY